MNPAITTQDRRSLPLILLLLGALALLALGGRTPAPAPAPLPLTAVEPWMLAALPGIGPKTAEQRLADLRRGDLSAFPAAAAADARRLFALPPSEAGH